MSDTPRTDSQNPITPSEVDDVWIYNAPMVNADFARQLERELNAANERIKRLEEVGNEVVWWFCQKEESQLSSMQSVALKRWRDLRGRQNP